MRASKYKEDDSEYILLGHSLGAYLAAFYAMKHPSNIMKLVLLSPVGVPKKPEDWHPDKIINEDSSFVSRFISRRACDCWGIHLTPFSLMRAVGYYGSKQMVNAYVKRQMGITNADERAAVVELMVQTSLRPKSSEAAITILLDVGAWACFPLSKYIEAIDLPICFMYGERDSMDSKDAEKLIPLLHGDS